jgi:EmrB/QacA subfamily drug resistance transporter
MMNKNFWVITASILASSMGFIDATALNVAIPAIQKAFDATGTDMLWIINGYLLMLAAFILPGGALGDKLGRKKVFMAGIITFMLASLACGLSWNSISLIVARIFQGLGGAFMIPGSLSLINANVTDEERGKAIGTWSSMTTLVTVGGPILGGLLADLQLWREVFLINIPLGILALLILAFKVPESRNESNCGPIDYTGAFLLALGLGCLSYGLLKMPDVGFQSLATGGVLLAGVGILAVFLWHEAKIKSPMLPLTLFCSSTFAGSNLLTLFLYGALSAGLFFLSLNLIQVQGYSQTLAGFATLPLALLIALLSRKAGRLSDRFGYRRFLIAGPAITGLGFFLLSLSGLTQGPTAYWHTFFPGILIFGLGMAITVAPLTTTVLASAGREYSGTASGVNNAVSRIAGVLAIAAIGAVVLFSFQSQLELKISSLPIPQEVRQELRIASRRLAEASPPKQLSANLQKKVRQAIRQSFIDTCKRVMVICTVLSGLSALFAFLLIRESDDKIRPSEKPGSIT